jgi:hypothetical protein
MSESKDNILYVKIISDTLSKVIYLCIIEFIELPKS